MRTSPGTDGTNGSTRRVRVLKSCTGLPLTGYDQSVGGSVRYVSMSTEFVAAVKRGDRDTVARMLDADRSHLGATDERGTPALLLAYYHGHPAVAEAMLAHRPELGLYEAAAVGDAGRIREIVATNGAPEVDAYASDGFTALGLAAFFKRADAVRVLLERGADPHLASRPSGFTPLHSAVATDAATASKDIVRMLLAANADPNARSASGGTPLHTVAFTGNVELTRLLLAAGGDATVKDGKGLTPLDIARERANSEVAALLHDAVIGKSS